MSQREFDREIPPDEQLREVSLILMQALYRLRRHGPPPRPPRVATPPATPIRTDAAPRRRKQTLPKPRHAKQKAGTYANQMKNLFRKRRPQKRRWWMKMVVSLDTIPCDQLDRAVCRTNQDADDLEFREAFDHAMRVLSPEDRRIAVLVAEHGMTHAAREVGVSWRQIGNTVARMRAVFEEAGLGPERFLKPSATDRSDMQYRADGSASVRWRQSLQARVCVQTACLDRDRTGG